MPMETEDEYYRAITEHPQEHKHEPGSGFTEYESSEEKQSEWWNPGRVRPWPEPVMDPWDDVGPPTRFYVEPFPRWDRADDACGVRVRELHVIGHPKRPAFDRLTKREPSGGGHSRFLRRSAEPLPISEDAAAPLEAEMRGFYERLMTPEVAFKTRRSVARNEEADEWDRELQMVCWLVWGVPITYLS
jgi:hypothetical protein